MRVHDETVRGLSPRAVLVLSTPLPERSRLPGVTRTRSTSMDAISLSLSATGIDVTVRITGHWPGSEMGSEVGAPGQMPGPAVTD